MSRLSTILIAVAMTVTAGSLAVVLSYALDFGLFEAGAVGLATLFGLALAHIQMERRRDRVWMEQRIAEIAAVAADANTEAGQAAVRAARADGDVGARVREETEPLAAEVEVLGHLMKQIAETVADIEIRHERRIEELAARPRIAAAPEPAVQPPAAPAVQIAATPEPRLAAPASAVQPEPSRVPSGFEREVETSIRAERIEIHLQPVVTLPQRKVRYYEVLTRLRGADGRLIPAAEFIPVAEARRLVAKVDTFQVIRSFQVLKRLTARNTEIGLFVNLSLASLADSTFFREFQAFLAQNRAVADLVQFEFRQDALAEMGPLEIESLRAIADLGFRFSVDNVTDLRTDFRGLSDLGFRTAKIAADRLLGRTAMPASDIHPADLAGHLQRQGIATIVDRIETESQVIDLLDYDVRLAQGFLFSAPRQVRPEILGSAAPAAQPAASPAAAAPRTAPPLRATR
ncbi:EAL domain-containing protein [Oharaeibacter diazotrophicus]|uniref:Diguanylate phosphodiesterase n=1 Tax=Oharaeibacter diazotrophicus TaxID=1920512 RepID=A0A4R6RBL4_9HYPH|nr:EAL domain-containing protein [Oharaeibacter diazotrophicus]TDP83462.1 diguanylate phosphodiesterase [Oharaeibacter diazotrophicus]BBE72295.1 putative membrane protein YjcC [Pleomorphomonas sp. SM30]GLS79065.1 diguanylate phosphodiesterase [Oharaeibacter diazotrophicus]